MARPRAFVLDTFALLAYLLDEPAAPRIQHALEDAEKEKCRLFLSVLNLGELLYITERRGGLSKAQDALALVRQLPVDILPADEQTVFAAVHIKAGYTLSFADAFAVAAALRENAVLLTADPEFEAVAHLVTLEWLEK